MFDRCDGFDRFEVGARGQGSGVGNRLSTAREKSVCGTRGVTPNTIEDTGWQDVIGTERVRGRE